MFSKSKAKITRRVVQPNQAITWPDETPDILQRIYGARGITDAEQLRRDLKQLHAYHNLLGIDAAVACLVAALQTQKHIVIIGDYDADGATSTALAVSALKTFGAKQVNFLVPNRFDYGYGLSPEIVDLAIQTYAPDVLITVDNGIASISGAAHALAKGLELVITDHHLPGEALPKATAIVNPNQPNDPFSSKNLAGVGVIFYVMSALRAALRAQAWFQTNNIVEPNLAEFLDLVALGTIADLVPLDHNNRVLVHQGLGRINRGMARPGIKALLQVARRANKQIAASDLAFAVGPRLNAAGRLQDMSLGIACLLAQDEYEAMPLATELDALNRERRAIEQDMKEQALKALSQLHLDANSMPKALCLYDETWHQGVIGILASRLKEQFHRPTIAFAKDDEHTIKGSARSVEGLHLRDLLAKIDVENPGLIIKFGGHAMAAGLSIKLADFAEFKQKFAEAADAQLTAAMLEGNLLSDGELSQAELNLITAHQIQCAGPWGQQFPEPLFDGVFTVVNQRLVGEKHLKLSLQLPSGSHLIDAIAFNIDLDLWPNYHCDKIHIAYRLDINEFNDHRSLQLIVEALDVAA